MASLLALGGGASEGLDTVLARMMLQQKMAEEERSNRADEAIRGRSVDESAAARMLAQTSLDQSRKDAELSRKRDDVRGIMAMRPANTEVSPETYKYETDNGAPEDFFLKRAAGANQEDVVAGVPESLARNNEVPNQYVFKGVRSGATTETSNQEHTYKLTDPALATKLGKRVGDVIDANYDPKTTRISYRGEDITSGVDHYEKPPAPDRVFVPTANELVPRSELAKRFAAGQTVPLPTTSSTRTMQEGASMVQPHIDDIKAQATKLDQAGLFGPVMSRLRHIAETAGSIDEFWDSASADPELQKMDPIVGRFATSLGLLASGAARVHYGGRAGSSPEAIKGFKAMMSDAATLDLFKGRLDGLDDFLTTYAAGPNAKPAAGAPDSGGLPAVGGTFNGGKVLKVTPIK